MRAALTGLLLFTAMASLVACQSPAPPPVATPDGALSADDTAVMRTVLDQLRQDRLGQSPGPPPLFLVLDSTLEPCVTDPASFRRLAPRCISRAEMQTLDGLAPGGDMALENQFKDRTTVAASCG